MSPDGKLMDVMGSSKRQDWRTPKWLFDRVCLEFPITLDVCAVASNAQARFYLSPEIDAFSVSWRNPPLVHDKADGDMLVGHSQAHTHAWMNPEYGKAIKRWVERAHHEARNGLCIVALLPARVDTKWWWSYVRQHEVRFLRGRLRFDEGPHAAPFPSAIVVFSPSPSLPRTIYWG